MQYFIEITIEFQLDFQWVSFGISLKKPTWFSINFRWYSIEISTGFTMEFNWSFIEFQLDFQSISIGISLIFPFLCHWNFNWIFNWSHWYSIEIAIEFQLDFQWISIGVSLKFFNRYSLKWKLEFNCYCNFKYPFEFQI